MAAAAIAAGVDVQGFIGAGLHGNGLMAEASKAGVFGAGVAWVGRIDLHHPAVFVAGQAKGIAQAVEPLGLAAEWHR